MSTSQEQSDTPAEDELEAPIEDSADDDDVGDSVETDDDIDADPELNLEREISADDFAALPEDIKPAYEERGDRFIAVPALQDVFDRWEAAYSQALAERDAKLAAKQAEEERLRADLHHLVITNAVRMRLIAGGCRPGLIRAGVAQFLATHDIQIERRADGTWNMEVEGPEGMIDVAHAVDLFLDAEENSPFLGKLREVQ